MPWFLKNDYIKLRKSEKSTSTDILFHIAEKELKKLNFYSSQQSYNLDLIDYSNFNKIKAIKLIKQITKQSVVEIQKSIKSLPIKLVTNVSLKEAQNLEIKLLNLGCITRIY